MAKSKSTVNTITKSSIVRELASATNCSMSAINEILDAYENIVEVAVKKGHKINFLGFISVQVKTTKARMGRNPKNGKPIPIPAKKKVVVKAGARLQKAANN